MVAPNSEIVSVDKTVKLFWSNVYLRRLYISGLLNFGTSIFNGPYVLSFNSVLLPNLCSISAFIVICTFSRLPGILSNLFLNKFWNEESFIYFDTCCVLNSSSRKSCNDTAFLSNIIVEACLLDRFSTYLILSLTIAFAASVFTVGILSLCLSSMAGCFIECSNFSAASCTSDFGLKTGPVGLTLSLVNWSCRFGAHSFQLLTQ